MSCVLFLDVSFVESFDRMSQRTIVLTISTRTDLTYVDVNVKEIPVDNIHAYSMSCASSF